MAARGIWSGTVSFGLVAFPVQLVTAVRKARISFNLLHDKDYSRLERRMYCPACNRFVESEEIIRGYEVEPDTYVPLSKEELESVSPERSRTIEVIDFVEIDQIDPIYFDYPYYLVPSKGGEKPYGLLVQILKQENKAGIAKFVMRDKEYLVAVRAIDEALVILTLHYNDEVLPEDVSPEKVEAETRLKNRFKKAIQAMTTDFHPEEYADERRRRILELLEKKIKEQGTVESPDIEEEQREGEPPDLIAALEESLRRVEGGD